MELALATLGRQPRVGPPGSEVAPGASVAWNTRAEVPAWRSCQLEQVFILTWQPWSRTSWTLTRREDDVRLGIAELFHSISWAKVKLTNLEAGLADKKRIVL